MQGRTAFWQIPARFRTCRTMRPNGNSDYSPEFIHNFQSAQAMKYNGLVKEAQQRLALIEAGNLLEANAGRWGAEVTRQK